MPDQGAGSSRPLSFSCAGACSFVAESEREKREWMEALQEAIAEMLYDYEVAEKIWSNKANKHCADCWAQSPDWASINLCVVICKQCAGQYIFLGWTWGSQRVWAGPVWGRQGAGWDTGVTWVLVPWQDQGVLTLLLSSTGQHRSLGSNISKVQSLKLDTSVWSNEIVQVEALRAEHWGLHGILRARLLHWAGQQPHGLPQDAGMPGILLLPADPGTHHDHGTLLQLFIVLGNDRANRFWAARLPAAEALYPDASAEQRRDFISRKYREGRYRLPHPHYATQEDVLQVGTTLGCRQDAGVLRTTPGLWV